MGDYVFCETITPKAGVLWKKIQELWFCDKNSPTCGVKWYNPTAAGAQPMSERLPTVARASSAKREKEQKLRYLRE
jgi:hypothetical protein